ncbi:serine/threonine-protein kinase [Polyangium jinanense]|uniref:Protein kinase n=1 Tax=Polyangium jinanense TaxID=2829994 RepID=A0A9X3X363_9BACT|nr:serine/threonine-protein kinase [Polyangium jinanense]MDC3954796.1 protein kinase [Polyangium jinanense]MDC3981433.1 protein kinase [Polyangium jinanense]
MTPVTAPETTQPDATPSSAPPGPPSVPLGLLTRFGEFEFLGSGGMGSVYRAKDRHLGRDVAVKFLHQADLETNRTLLREARAQARIEHEHACKVHEVGTDGDRPYIVMQYIAGKSLDCASERMTREQKVRAVQQVSMALHEAHRLGIIHRDVKPGNIMVEQGEDGAYKPYIMDFGIAREMGKSIQVTASLAGTPAYMAPEQASGDAETLDRRTDVYGLGATLYDLLTGRPPFEGSHALAVMRKLLTEDPPQLGKIRPDVPEDLQAIVMKCLEKEQGRRYESALALGEDLQRFLDGKPVLARRASLGYVLLKAARRHKVRVALGAALFVVLLVFGVFWIRQRQALAEQTALSRELGEDVKEMELFLSRAYSLPLHDIERERSIVRQQLRDIEARMATLGRAGEGPGHYALGRGFLALQEPEEALAHLRRAEAAGYTPPELRYAMGLVLVELYRKALEETKRIQDEARKKARFAAIDAEYKSPALAHLRAALGARLSSPAYVEGLIALHEGQNDVAFAKAREAFAQSPWLHEAKKLEGDAHFAEGKRFGRDAAFDYDRMMRSFEPAAAAYAEAASIARSDPAVHEAECELWTQVVFASDARPELLRPSFEKAVSACGKALAADPQRGSARLTMAFAQNAFAWQVMNGPGQKDPEAIIRVAIDRAEEAARRRAGDPMAHYLVGAAYRMELLHRMNRGLEARDVSDRAIAAHEEAIRLDPGFLWPYNEVCASYVERARSENWRGVDPSPSVERATSRCDQAFAQNPSFTYPALYKAHAHLQKALHLVEHGRSPEAPVASALEAVAAVKEHNPLDAAHVSAWAFLHRASHACNAGQDPSASLERAEAFLREKEQLAPSSANDELWGLVAMTRALYLLRQGKDPTMAVEAARGFFRKSAEGSPWDVDYRVEQARTETIALRWALAKGNADAAMFGAAFAPLLPVLDKERANPQVYEALAEIYELRAGWLLGRRKNAEKDLTMGRVMADKALAIHPNMATALAAKGALSLLRVSAARDAKEKQQAAREAKASLESALRENPLLARERGAAVKEAQGMFVQAGAEE